MTGPTAGVQARLADVAGTCEEKLKKAPFVEALPRLGPHAEPAAAFALLQNIPVHPPTGKEIRDLCCSVFELQAEPLIERTLLLLASLHASKLVPTLPIADSVKRLYAQEFEFFADPPERWVPHFACNDVRFREMARIATLRRFPAGQFHWEISGLPRSWILKTRDPWRLIEIVKMGGFSPLFELHLNARRKNRLILLETEANLSYYRAAQSIRLQPGARGLMLASWFFCKSTAQVTPHLAWLREGLKNNGALLLDLGLAPPDSGFLTGSEERRMLYQEGKYQPQTVCVVWPRKQLLRWADEHPGLAE